MTRKKRLGRGLEALLNSTAEPASTSSVAVAASPVQPDPYIASAVRIPAHESRPAEPAEGDIVHLNVYDIQDNPFQPRRIFSESEIASLSESLKEHDILQPILVRKVDGRYQLISGERRLRASIKAGWKTIPARIREADDRLVSELAIVENLQRKDLNAIEKAMSFRRYIDQHRCTQDELAGRLKLDRSTIANLMRLLELPAPIKNALQAGKLSAGHARALLPLGEELTQIEFLNSILSEGMSVRATERAVAERIATEDDGSRKTPRRNRTMDNQVASLQQELKTALGTNVSIKPGAAGRGKIEIKYGSEVEFQRIRQLLMGSK